MDEQACVMEYKCPCCGAGLTFGPHDQKLKCEYCENSFDLDAVRAFNEEKAEDSQSFRWENDTQTSDGWTDEETEQLNVFQCPSCGGEIITDSHTAATFCPYCSNPTILPSRLAGCLKPEGVIPFRTGKDDAKAAFLSLCKGKPLLPKEFTTQQQLEKITGIYVPFWLYDCVGNFQGSYKATRLHHWADANYNYTRTEHFLLRRSGAGTFKGIPMDGSSKMDDTFMESIEPFDYGQLQPFNTAYLTGYLADKYDVESNAGEERIRRRVETSIQDCIQSTILGYATVIPTSRKLDIQHSKARYVMMPVWLLNTRYKGKLYTFTMNGQTGKMTGSFPICPKRSALWFSGICAGVSVLAAIVQLLLL